MEKIIPKTLLVVKNRALGDAVMGLGAIQYLKEIHPETTVIYGLPPWICPLFKNAEHAADTVLPLSFKTLGEWWQARKAIKALGVTDVLELFQSGRTAKFFSLWERLGGPRYVFHNHHKSEGEVRDQGVIKSNIQRDLDAAYTFYGKSEIPSFLNYCPKLVPKNSQQNEVTPKSQKFILGVVATRETKMWPLKSFARLSHLLSERFPEAEILIPLGPGDTDIEKQIQLLNFSPNSKVVKENLSHLSDLFANSDHYIGNDTGLKHICIALGVPTFTLFGPEPPTEWHPYDSNNHPYYFREPLECRTRSAHYCGLSTCESMICLNEFSPESLMDRLF